MGVLNLTFRNGTFVPAFDPSQNLATTLGDAARDLPPGSSVVVLLHGFRYDPDLPHTNPHTRIYATHPASKRPKRHMSWLAALGFRGLPDDPGLCIAVGWPARGRLSGAYDRAGEVGRALAVLIAALAALMPEHPVKIMGHSLGARVALCCLHALNAPHIAQVILLAPAEFRSVADHVLDNPATRMTEILQISPVENWLFDKLLVQSLRHKACGHALGQSAPTAPNWVSLRLDSDGELDRLASLGHVVEPRGARVCHWSAYLRGGLMELYAEVLTGSDSSLRRSFAQRALMPDVLVPE
ncbi:MAG: DUF726 domain-containing protein [Dinoroseobacter sp.]|nr:DUF726 domain-containing protein [Dinoroseobacter sp.]